MRRDQTRLKATGIFGKTSYTERLLSKVPNKIQCFRTFDDAMELPENPQ